MNRKSDLLEWTKLTLQDQDCYIKPASSDASFRSYWRVFSQSKTFIVMDAPIEHEDCRPFIDISKKLIESGVNAPAILHQNLEQGFLLLTDLGSTQYLDVLTKETFNELYQDAINALHNIQQKTSMANLPLYDKPLLKQEMQLFDVWFIDKHLGITLSKNQKKIINKCQKTLTKNALEQPQSFVHRDYHSRNLMYNKNNNPGILDFQDAVVGPITYDLVSLLKDCYISWDETDINRLSDDFRQQFNGLNQSHVTESQWQKWFDLMGMQRHLKAVGIFCRLNYRDNKPNYLKDINRTLCYIKTVCQKYSELKPFLIILEDITPSIDTL